MVLFLGNPLPFPPITLIASFVSRLPHTTYANANQFLQLCGIPYVDVLTAITQSAFFIHFKPIIRPHGD